MTAAQWIGLGLKFSLMAIVFCVALNTRRGDLLSLLRRPSLCIRSILAMNIVMPVIAALLAAVFNLNRQLEVALIALAVAPVPPILPNKQIKAGGSASYSVALLGLSAALSIVLIPVVIDVLARAFGHDLRVPPSAVFRAVALSVLAPLLAGVVVRELAPKLAAAIVKPLTMLANILLIVAFIPVIIIAWPHLAEQAGNFTLVAIVVLVLTGLLVGHVLGGPHPADRTALALATASRHPGVAVAVAGIIAPNDKSVVMAVLLAFLVAVIVTGPYARLRARRHAGESV